MPIKTLMTAAEFASTGPETDGYELVLGELCAMPPPSNRHGLICARVMRILFRYLDEIGHGQLMSNDAGILTRKNPDSVRGADVALFLNPSWAGKEELEVYTDEPPDLVVEVRSPSQTWPDVVTKVGEYLQMGVRLVWVVDPKVKRVRVFSMAQEVETFAAENDITGGEVLPGFRCQVAEFFA